jgi:hypothetical protein
MSEEKVSRKASLAIVISIAAICSQIACCVASGQEIVLSLSNAVGSPVAMEPEPYTGSVTLTEYPADSVIELSTSGFTSAWVETYPVWSTNFITNISSRTTFYGSSLELFSNVVSVSLDCWYEGEISTNRFRHSDIVELLTVEDFWITHVGDTFIGDPRDDPRVRKAMQEYRMEHPVCEYDKGTVPIEVHHILPIAYFREFAACKWNMISLSDGAHLWVGHAGNYHRYVFNIRDICNRVIVVEKGD